MNVLSLFDGISAGRVALERAGIKVDNYYACEIDTYAIKIAQANYPDTIQLGSVVDVSAADIPHKIDLIIGGSPCQGFSFAGKQLNFDDPRSQLFFEFVRLMKECKPKYFLLENVKMKKQSEDVITEMLGVSPIEINSALVSAQNRKRLYWTNINFDRSIEDQNIMLKDILEQQPHNYTLMSDKFTSRNANAGCLVSKDKPKARTFSAMEYVKNGRQGDYIQCDKEGRPTLCRQIGIADDINGHDILKRVYSVDGKSPTLNTCSGGNREPKIAIDDKHYRKLTCIEAERLQTFPDGYTEGVSNTRRYHALGNSWTVDVVCHIFNGLRWDEETI